MNFSKSLVGNPSSRKMKEADLVIVYERHDSMDHFYIERGKIFNNKYGAFYHDDFIGKCFGSKIISRCKNGWVYALEPTPELWTQALHSRTQIVDHLDSSVIIMNLDVYPGCTVVESGPGSGCMSLALARAVFPDGHVHTFEYNATRAESAAQEFKKFVREYVCVIIIQSQLIYIFCC